MTNASAAFAALSEPMRLAIVEHLAGAPATVGALAGQVPVSLPAVAQHLKVLKEAGLVDVEAAGTRRIYRIDPAGLGPIRQWLDRFGDQPLAAYAAAAEREEEE